MVIPGSAYLLYDEIFRGCTGLEKVVIEEGVKKIPGGSFAGCTSLASVTIPDSVTQIFVSAFDGVDKVIIGANPESYAEKWAREHNIPVREPELIRLSKAKNAREKNLEELLQELTELQEKLDSLSGAFAGIRRNLLTKQISEKHGQIAATKTELAEIEREIEELT